MLLQLLKRSFIIVCWLERFISNTFHLVPISISSLIVFSLLLNLAAFVVFLWRFSRSVVFVIEVLCDLSEDLADRQVLNLSFADAAVLKVYVCLIQEFIEVSFKVTCPRILEHSVINYRPVSVCSRRRLSCVC